MCSERMVAIIDIVLIFDCFGKGEVDVGEEGEVRWVNM